MYDYSACMHICVPCACPVLVEVIGTGSHDIGVINGCQLFDFAGNQTQVLCKEKKMLITTELSSFILDHFFFFEYKAVEFDVQNS